MSTKVDKYGDSQKVFQDYAAPKLLKAALNATNNLVLTFDEPIHAAANGNNEDFKVTVDGTTFTITPATAVSTAPLTYTVTTDAALTGDYLKAGVHNVVVYNARDIVSNNGAGGNKVAILNGSYEIKQGEAPYVEEIEMIDFNSFEVTFSESVSNAKVVVKKGNTEFYNAVVGTGKVASIDLPVSVSSPAAPNGITYLYDQDAMSTNISIVVKDYKDTDDLLGNQYSQSLKLERDDLLPKALGESQNAILASDALQVVFNRKIDNLDLSKVTVLDKDGISRAIHSSTALATVGAVLTDNAIDIVLSKGAGVMNAAELNELAPFRVQFAPGALEVDTDFVDVTSDKVIVGDGGYDHTVPDNTNSLENIAHTTKVAKDDDHAYKAVEAVDDPANAPFVTATVVNGAVENVITITYKEEMGVSAAKVANYTLDGVAMPAGTTISMDGDNKVVTIKLPAETFAKNVEQKIVISDNVMTKAGSHVVGNLSTKEVYMSDLVQFTDNTKAVLESAKFVVVDMDNDTTSTKVRLTFNENVDASSVDPDNFILIAHDGTEIEVTGVTDGTLNDKVVELTIAAGDAVNMSQTVKVKVVPKSVSGAAQAITDLEGNEIKEGTIVTVSGKVQ